MLLHRLCTNLSRHCHTARTARTAVLVPHRPLCYTRRHRWDSSCRQLSTSYISRENSHFTRWYFLRCLWLLYFIRNKLAVNYAAQTDWQSIWNCHVTVAIFDCCCLGFAKSHLGCTLYDWLFCFVQREPFNAVTPIIGCLLILFLQMAQKFRVLASTSEFTTYTACVHIIVGSNTAQRTGTVLYMYTGWPTK